MSQSSIGGPTPPGPDRRRPRAAAGGGRPGAAGASTSERILDAALASFATRGYEASSLDALAAGLEVRKQTILYWFPSKEVLLEAVIDRSAIELSNALEGSLAAAGGGTGPTAIGSGRGRPSYARLAHLPYGRQLR